jgi:hypothetical protein
MSRNSTEKRFIKIVILEKKRSYNCGVQLRSTKKKQTEQTPTSKRLHKGIIDTNDVMCSTCKRHFKKQGIKQHITKMH